MQERKPISPVVAGLIIGAVMIIYSLMLSFLNMEGDRAMGWLGYAIMLAGLIIFINLYGKSRDNQVTFGNLFGYGFKATAMLSLLLALFLIGYFVLMPENKEKILEISRSAMEKQGSMTDEQIDSSMEMMDKNFMLFFVGTAIFMYIFMGVIGSLIGAAVTKKRPVTPFDQRNL